MQLKVKIILPNCLYFIYSRECEWEKKALLFLNNPNLYHIVCQLWRLWFLVTSPPCLKVSAWHLMTLSNILYYSSGLIADSSIYDIETLFKIMYLIFDRPFSSIIETLTRSHFDGCTMNPSKLADPFTRFSPIYPNVPCEDSTDWSKTQNSDHHNSLIRYPTLHGCNMLCIYKKYGLLIIPLTMFAF